METNLCSPNEDFGTSKNIRSRHFVSAFHTPNYSVWAKSDEKYLQNVLTEYFSTFQNLRLGAIKFERLFDFQQGEIILGSKIHHNQLICVCGHHILICDLLTGENKKYIKLSGIVPNDLCIVGNHVYCGGNVTTNPDCGVVLQICLATHRQCIVIDKRSFVCGINALKNKLYVSSLNEIAAFDLQTFEKLETFTNNVDCPLYDNISVYKTEQFVAIFQKSPLIYSLLDNPISKRVIYRSLLYSGLLTVGDELNHWRRLNGNKISYVRIKNGMATHYVVDYAFDDTTTQIARLDKNWKAKWFIVSRYRK